jgi:short-subunit dehydrogenase involved in D-alanine esterification of teichoic acids
MTGTNGPCDVEIKKAGGKAVADYNSVVDGDKIVETAVKAFGTVHILLNNAGIHRYLTLLISRDSERCFFQEYERCRLGSDL